MKNRNVLLIFVLLLSLTVSGCCTNYKTYANSMALDLEALDATYRGYVTNDERLSDADIKARLSILEEMKDKTRIAQEDVNN